MMHTRGLGCSVPAEPCQLIFGVGQDVTGKERVSRRCPVGWNQGKYKDPVNISERSVGQRACEGPLD